MQARMWAHRVVMLPPIFNHDLGLDAVPEPFHCQALVPKFAVAAFVRTVLPRLARIDQRTFNALLGHPFQQRDADKFRAVVAAQVTRRARS